MSYFAIILREIKPDRKKNVLEHYAQRADDFTVEYDVTRLLEGLTVLGDDHLLLWEREWQQRAVKVKEEALDVLYRIVFPSKN